MPGALHLQHPANAYQANDIAHLNNFNPVNDYYLNLARVGGFHLQGMEGRSHSVLLQALANAADVSLRLARRVKIIEKK